MSSKSVKLFLFDTIYATYSFSIGLYVASWFTPWQLTQDDFIANFDQFMYLLAALVLLSVFAGLLAPRLGIVTTGHVLFSEQPLTVRQRRPMQLHLAAVLALTLIVSVSITESSLRDLLDEKGLAGAWRLWSGLSQPNWSLLPKAIAEATETIFIAFLATVLAVPIAFVLAFFTAKNLMVSRWSLAVYAALRLWLNVTRSVEPLIWALIFTVWVGVGPFAGMLALMIHSVASLTKYYSEIIEEVDPRPIDAIRSTGANGVQTVWYGVVPQVLLPYIAMTIYRWDTNVRMATVIGLVGGGGIGTLLVQYQGQAMWPEVGAIILVIAVIVWAMDTASALIRQALK